MWYNVYRKEVIEMSCVFYFIVCLYALALITLSSAAIFAVVFYFKASEDTRATKRAQKAIAKENKKNFKRIGVVRI